GTTRVDYFYQSYIKSFPEKLVDEDMFHYPGPIPFSRETAVLMMADSVEAASRSLKEPTAQSLNDLVDKIIGSKMNQKQFINSNITLKDITTVSEIFKEMLKSIYHVRIDYDTGQNTAASKTDSPVGRIPHECGKKLFFCRLRFPKFVLLYYVCRRKSGEMPEWPKGTVC